MNKLRLYYKLAYLATIICTLFSICPYKVFAEENDIFVSIETNRVGYNGYDEYGTVRAYDNNGLIWEFITPTGPLTELQVISDVYVHEDTVYVVAHNILYALNIENGDIKWTVSNVGASNQIIFDNEGNIYISGAYGPNVLIIDANGQELYRDENSEYTWVYKLSIQDQTLNIYYGYPESGMMTLDISQFLEPTNNIFDTHYRYSDIKETESYFIPITVLSERGIIDGYEDGTFRPNNILTRAEFAKLVVMLLGQEKEANSWRGYSNFSDVESSHWALGYITIGVEDGFISGYGNGSFGPDDSVTYAQAVKMLVSAAGEEYELEAQRNGGWPTGYNIVGDALGITDNVFKNNVDEISRGEASIMIYNALMIIEN